MKLKCLVNREVVIVSGKDDYNCYKTQDGRPAFMLDQMKGQGMIRDRDGVWQTMTASPLTAN